MIKYDVPLVESHFRDSEIGSEMSHLEFIHWFPINEEGCFQEREKFWSCGLIKTMEINPNLILFLFLKANSFGNNFISIFLCLFWSWKKHWLVWFIINNYLFKNINKLGYQKKKYQCKVYWSVYLLLDNFTRAATDWHVSTSLHGLHLTVKQN